MCGRFTLTAGEEELLQRYGIDSIPMEYGPRYNIAPGQLITAIISHQGQRRIGQLKWGLVPNWAKDEIAGFKMINARSETVRVKSPFKALFIRKRCIIPADSFYEWRKTAFAKQPMRIMLKSGELFSMAGLYDTWTSPDGCKVHTCTILTVQPNELVSPIHHRMPAILRREDEELWLDRNEQNPDLLQSLLTPYPADEMKAYPVPAMVGNVRVDEPGCIEEIDTI